MKLVKVLKHELSSSCSVFKLEIHSWQGPIQEKLLLVEEFGERINTVARLTTFKITPH